MSIFGIFSLYLDYKEISPDKEFSCANYVLTKGKGYVRTKYLPKDQVQRKAWRGKLQQGVLVVA